MADPEYQSLISFVPAGKEPREETFVTDRAFKSSLTGEDAKSFYESLIENKPTGVNKVNSTRNRKVQPSRLIHQDTASECRKHRPPERHVERSRKLKSENEKSKSESDKLLLRNGNELLKCAEHGNLMELQRGIKEGIDINYIDAFGWTALMCASVARHADIVEELLKHGANRNLMNNQGKTALQLANDIGAIEIVHLIKQQREKEKKKRNRKKKVETMYCETCKQDYTEYKSHLSSTVHLFNMKFEPKPDPFLIPESNVGYKMMRLSGWDGEKGLGPEGQGLKYPVRTTLKRDRSCLGSEESKSKARITHYGPNDMAAVKSYRKNPQRLISARTISKRERLKKEKKAKEWERKLRFEMNMD